jgi:hypothetical protein
MMNLILRKKRSFRLEGRKVFVQRIHPHSGARSVAVVDSSIRAW